MRSGQRENRLLGAALAADYVFRLRRIPEGRCPDCRTSINAI